MPPSPSWVKKSDMLIVARKLSELRFSALTELYEIESLQKEQDLYAYLREELFPRGMCCIWQAQGRYVSALRLQPWGDGWLLEGLQTHSAYRRNGYGKQLVTEALRDLNLPKVYVHIQRNNVASVSLHIACGFQKCKHSRRYPSGSRKLCGYTAPPVLRCGHRSPR